MASDRRMNGRMDVAAFTIGCVALTISIFNAVWQVVTWRHAHRFDVRVRIEHELVTVGSGKYEITVVVQNIGATSEAVQHIVLLYAEHVREYGKDTMLRGPASLQDSEVAGSELPPLREVRKTYDLLATTFGLFPSEVTAYVTLQSGQQLVSAPFKTDSRSARYAIGQIEEKP